MITLSKKISNGMLGSNMAQVIVTEGHKLFGKVITFEVKRMMRVTETTRIPTPGGGYLLRVTKVDPQDGGGPCDVHYDASRDCYIPG